MFMELPNQLRIRDNGKVRKVKISKDRLQKYNEFVAANKNTLMSKHLAIKELIGGVCCICGDIPDVEVVYPLEGATRIERYCNDCIKSVYAREQVL